MPSLAGTQSIKRTVALLKQVATHNMSGLRLTDAARETGLTVPTARRVLACLAAEGLVMQQRRGERYFLGPLTYELGLASNFHFNLREVCEPALRRLAQITGDTIFLTIRRGTDSVVIDRMEGSYPIKVLTQGLGARRPLGSTVGGLALLMPLPAEEIAHIIAANEPRLAHYGKLDKRVLLNMLECSRKLGYALNANDILEGVTGIGVAIPDRLHRPFVAISLIAISSRLSGKRRGEMVRIVKSEANALGRVLANL